MPAKPSKFDIARWNARSTFPAKEKAPRGFSPLGADFSGGELSGALLYGDHKRDGAIFQIDAECVGVNRLKVAGGHVEHPHATGIAEGSVRNIVILAFVRVRNLAAYRT